MAKKINREEIKAEVKRRQQNAARDYAEKANLIAAGYKTAKTNSASGSAGKKPIGASNSKSNVLSQIDEIRNDLGSRNKLSADALIANNPAYVYTKAYGDGKTGAAANRPVKGTATPRSRFEPADTGRPLGRASAQRAFTSTPTGNFKGEAILKSALSSSGAAYKKLGADVTSATGNLSMGESARAAINEAKTAKKEGRQVRPGQAQRKAEQEKIKSFNDGWAGDFKQKLLESAEESSKRAYEYEQEAKQGLGKFGQGVVDFGIAGAQFAGDALLNAVAPGTGIAAMAGRAYGSASLDAQQRGLSEGEQQISGLKSAAIEVLTEKLFGSVSKVAYGKGIIRNESLVNSLVNRLAKTDRGRTALKVLVGANEEGLEEVLSDILNPIADRILKLDDGKGDWSDLADDFDTQQMLDDYIIGGALGLVGAGTNVVSGQYRAENAQQRAYEEYQRQLVNAGLATDQGGDAQLTAEKYKNILDQSTQRGKRNLSDKETENLERLMTIGTDTQTVRDMLAQSGVLVDDNTAQAAALAASGQKLSSTQNAAIGNAAVQDAINQMAGNGVVDNIRRTAANEYSKPIVINSMARQYEVAPEVVERTYNLNPTAPQAFATAFDAVYQMGQQGTDKAALYKVPVLNTAQANIAYQMGADSVKNVSTETAAQAATPVQAAATINNTQEVNDNGVRIHNVAERINGQNTEGQIRGVETGAGENVAGGSQKEQGGISAAQIKAGEKVSYKGKQQKGVYYAAEDTEDMKKGRELAESYGYKVMYFVGGNIRYAGGEFRGVVDTANKTVMVRADHPDYTADQIMRHEMGHAAFENGDLSLNEAKEMLLGDFTEDELNELIEIYNNAYGGILSTEETFEEICCDALGRMNIFEGTDLNSESYGKAQDTVRKYAAERTGSKGRAPPKKGGVKYSKEVPAIDLSDISTLSKRIGNVTGAKRYNIIRDFIMDELSQQPIVLSDGRKAVVDKSDALHIANKSRSKKTAEIAQIRKIVETAQLVAEETSTKNGKFKHFYYYEASVRYRGETFNVYLNVGVARNDATNHIYDITQNLRDTAQPVAVGRLSKSFALRSGISDKSIHSSSENVNEKFSREVKSAEEYFGTTYKVKEAGYICTDGKMLDFSGRHEGAPGGYRTVDHRDITDALGEDYGGEDYSGGMIKFMSEGNIRVSPESGGINLSVSPNKAQRSTLDRYISSFRGEVILDIDRTNGDTIASVEYPKYTHSSVVFKDIDDYFDKGKIPKKFSREPERLNELRRQNERKLAQATAEDAANENERGLIRDYQKQYGKVEGIREKLNSAQQTLTEAEDGGADYDTTTKAKNRFTLLSKQYACEHRRLNGYGSTKALQNVLERVNARTARDTGHIDNRSFSSVSDRGVKPFQMEHPELHKYYEDMAQTVLYDIGMATQFRTTNGYPKTKFTDGFKRALGGSSFNDGLQALLDISNDQGSENYALAKRMELFLDDLLTNGYKGASGNAEYIRAKENISGGNTAWENFLEENSLAIADGLITEKELYKEFTQMRSDLPEGMGAASANFTGNETVGERWVTEAQGEGDSALHPISKEQEANLAEQQQRAPQEIPKKDLNGKLTSKHVSTIVNSGMTPAEFSEAMLDDAALGKFSHIAYSDEEALKKAERAIEDDGWDQALANYKAEINSGRVSKDNTVMGIALYNNAVNSGDYATAMDIASLMVKNSTNTAQSLQAMRILNKLSPECRLYLAAKSIENIEEDLNERYKDNKADIHVDKILYDEYAKALRQGDEDGIKTAWANIEQSVAQQIDATWYEKLNNFRYLAMLGNPRTHVRNIVGNAFFVPVRAVKNTIAYGLENIADAKINGGIERSKAILNPNNAADAALVKYAMSDYEAVQEVILSGGKYVDTFQGIDKHRTIYKTKILEAARKGNSAALDAEDAWFCKPAYANALAKWYKANGISAEQLNTGNVPEETIIKAQTIAIKEAQKATYRDTNWFSAQVSRLGKVDNKVAAVLIEGVLPFKKTPANILARAVEYSPVGLVKSLALDTKKVKAYVNGDVENGMSPAQFIDDVSAGLTGSALMGLGILLASWGVLSGGDDDDEKQNYFDDLSGKQNYALSIGGLSITLDWLAPESMPLFVGVELFNSLSSKNEDKGFLQNLMSSVMSLSTPMFEMSMLQSVNDLFDNLAYIKQGQGTFKIVSSMAANYISQYFPTLFGQTERSFEETQRETTYIDRNSKVGSEIQYMWGKIANKIPFYDFSQIPYIDAWGRTEETGNLFERMLNNFINPAYVKKERPTEIDGELERLYDLGETSVYPSRAKTNTKINGEYLTADEYVKYATTKGQTSYELAQGVINSAAYSGASDPEKAYMLKYVYSYADHIAKYEVNNDYSLAKWEMAAYKSANPMQAIIDHAREYYNPDKEN